MTDTGEGRERSTIRFPYGDLDDAVTVASTIHDKFGLSCALDQLAAGMGQTVSGAFRNKVATAATFGLIETTRGGVELTDLGARALDPQTSAGAATDAFLTVPLYAAVYERFRGRQLPTDQGFEAEIVRLGVSPKVAKKARQALQRSAEQAGFFLHGRDRLVLPATDTMPSVPATNGREGVKPTPPIEAPAVPGPQHPMLVGLWQELPDPKAGDFGSKKQVEWLETAKAVLKLLYGSDATGAAAGSQTTHDATAPSG